MTDRNDDTRTHSHGAGGPDGSPRPTAEEIRRRLARRLSLSTRLGLTALFLFDLAVAATVGSLLLTEPGLPPETSVAFALITAGALAWAVLMAAAAGRRTVFLARHRVIAGRMAVGFSAAFTLAAAAVAIWRPETRHAAVAATGLGAFLTSVAGALLYRAVHRHDELIARRRRLEAELAR